MRTSIYLFLLLILYYIATYVEKTFPNEEYFRLEGGLYWLLVILFFVCLATDVAELINRLRGKE